MTEQNWTQNQELAALVDELDDLIQRLFAIGETNFPLVLQAVSVARVVDSDDSTTSVALFTEPAQTILKAALR